MAEITEKRMRHYTGLDADKASIPAGGKEKGDSYHATDKGKQYYWDGSAWKTGLGYEYVERRIGAWDRTEVDFTWDGAWHVNGLDLSGIVPAEAKAVVLAVMALDDAASTAFNVRPNATDIMNLIDHRTQVANVWTPLIHYTLPIDADRLMDYFGAAGMGSLFFAVVGWYI